MVKFASVAVHCGGAAPAAIATSPRHEPGAPSVVPNVLDGGAPHHPDVGCGAATAASRRRGANVGSCCASSSSDVPICELLGTPPAASCTWPRDCESGRSADTQAASAHNASSKSGRRVRRTAACLNAQGGSSCAPPAAAVRCLDAHSARGAIMPHTSARVAGRTQACQLSAQPRARNGTTSIRQSAAALGQVAAGTARLEQRREALGSVARPTGRK